MQITRLAGSRLGRKRNDAGVTKAAQGRSGNAKRRAVTSYCKNPYLQDLCDFFPISDVHSTKALPHNTSVKVTAWWFVKRIESELLSPFQCPARRPKQQ